MSETKPKQDDPAQSQRFIDIAREVEVDERPEAFEKALKKIIESSKRRQVSRERPDC